MLQNRTLDFACNYHVMPFASCHSVVGRNITEVPRISFGSCNVIGYIMSSWILSSESMVPGTISFAVERESIFAQDHRDSTQLQLHVLLIVPHWSKLSNHTRHVGDLPVAANTIHSLKTSCPFLNVCVGRNLVCIKKSGCGCPECVMHFLNSSILCPYREAN